MTRLYTYLLLLLLGCSLEPKPIEYTVKRGDTLGKIAKAYDVSVDDLRMWNSISGDLIEVGQIVQIRRAERPKTIAKTTVKSIKKKPSTRTPNQSGLRMPPKKKCLAGPSLDELSDDVPDIQSSAGLSYVQIQKPMATFLPNLSRCFEASWPEARVLFEITAGCNGRVASVSVLDDGGLSGSDIDCMRSTLSYVGFPAHDMPDGMTFQYPVTLGG